MTSKRPHKLAGFWLKVTIPVLIGIVAVIWMFQREYVPGTWESVRFTWRAVVGIALAWCFMVGRDFGLTWRFRSLTDRKLSWLQSLRVTMMCEFTSAVTPSTVGGSALGVIFMHREGLQWGRATTLMLVTLFLDELFFVIACPLAFCLEPYRSIFAFGSSDFVKGLRAVFWVVYSGITLWTILLFIGIFIKPHAIRNMLNGIFRWRLLKRWQKSIIELGNSMVEAGYDLRNRTTAGWWMQAGGATALSWISRFLIINALFWGFVGGGVDQLMVFCRQVIVWLVLTISPTPGGTGVSEWLFTDYYGDLIQNAMPMASAAVISATILAIALFWRIISYYIYLVIGIFIVPSFFRNKKSRK